MFWFNSSILCGILKAVQKDCCFFQIHQISLSLKEKYSAEREQQYMMEIVYKAIVQFVCGYLAIFVLLPVGFIALAWIIYAIVMTIIEWRKK